MSSKRRAPGVDITCHFFAALCQSVSGNRSFHFGDSTCQYRNVCWHWLQEHGISKQSRKLVIDALPYLNFYLKRFPNEEEV